MEKDKSDLTIPELLEGMKNVDLFEYWSTEIKWRLINPLELKAIKKKKADSLFGLQTEASGAYF